MDLERVAKLRPIDRLVYWIRERETIRQRKEAGEPWPWTDDPILRRYRFCNVIRRDDRVSRWLIRHWYNPYKDHPNMLIACALARFFNRPETLELIGFPETWEPERVKQQLRAYRRQGNTIFNGAYMVRGNDGTDKVSCVVDYTVCPLADNPPPINTDSMRKTWAALVPRRGMGSFMAGQITADLRLALTGQWKDRRVWAPMGPGSRRGLNRVLERRLNHPLNQEAFESYLTELINNLEPKLPRGLTRRMEAIDWQNCLCEFDRYERTLFNQGRPKRIYRVEN